MAKVAKKILITVPGIGRVESLPGGSFNPGGNSRAAVVTESDRVHYSEETAPATLSFRLPNLPDTFDQVRDMAGVNVNVQDDSGQSWIVTDAFTTTPASLSNGEISVEMSGNPAEKV
ncbi:phage tail tube protein [Neptunomonas antarctica]|uniref:Phage tail tube protein n=1 Tax=Neptunomonas antarctica TaxID=619304 RepID=A0A1N7MPD0_9GAMM|nr:phage tail tube protein [Neptunomonas antarctica]SIS87858.1 Phage tail tube protein [Neptunomonas antarctica]